jgi:ABC-type multidrug transport system fused ATPase/permease subunit
MRNTAGCNPGTIVTLGTPFLDTNTARIAAKRKIDRHTSGIYWLMYAILYTMLSACLIIAILLAFYAAWQGWSIFRAFEGLRSILDNESQIPAWKSFFRYALNTTPQWLLVVSCLALVLLALLTVSGLLSKRRKRTSDGWDNFWTHAGKDKPFWLVLASLKDEAWQLLHHIRTISNPLSPNVSMLAQMRADRQEYIEGSWSQLRLRGIRPLSDYGRLLRFCIWLSLLLAAVAVICAAFAIMLRGEEPWLDLYRGEGSVSLATTIARVAKYALYAYAVVFAFSIIAGGRGYAAAMHSLNYSIKVLFNSFSVIPNGIIPYLVRQRGWHIIQQIALGLKGFEWDLPEVRQVPEFARDCAVLSLLTERTERRALARRNEWAASYLGDISQVLSKMVLSAADISFLVRLVEEDSSLVHASYYTDEECIDRIARWIAGKS